MTEHMLSEAIQAAYPSFSEQLRGALISSASLQLVDAGAIVISEGGVVRGVPLILEGAMEVTRLGPDGEGEVLLYYLEPGTTCAASLSCCSGRRASVVRATTALPSKILTVPTALVERWTVSYPSWRAFVFATYTGRFDELLGGIDALAFGDLRGRLVANLLDKRRIAGPDLSLTHRQLAKELNTSRVVITRLLRAMEREGAVTQARGHLRIVDLPPERP